MLPQSYQEVTDNRLPPPTKTESTAKNEEIDVETIVRKKIIDELNDIDIVKYETRVDNDYDDYDDAMSNKLSDFSDARSFLLPDKLAGEYYNELKNQFPICHFVFATIVSSWSYYVPVNTPLDPECIKTSKEELHRKHRLILYIFLGLIWTMN